MLTLDAPERIVGNRAYDSDALDEPLEDEGIELISPHRSDRRPSSATQDGRQLRKHKRRWMVERTIAGFQNFRRPCARYEKVDSALPGLPPPWMLDHPAQTGPRGRSHSSIRAWGVESLPKWVVSEACEAGCPFRVRALGSSGTRARRSRTRVAASRFSCLIRLSGCGSSRVWLSLCGAHTDRHAAMATSPKRAVRRQEISVAQRRRRDQIIARVPHPWTASP